ncbi:MAG TPA: substrate-binding domain-containing protein [Saliniramus sp.]|nr:substrate-binding domain-containing protein [Saliniramus sp.]
MKFTTLTSAIAIAAAGFMVVGDAAAQSRNQIRIVGSSTVFPYTQAVAEEFANASGNPAPVVESTGTGGGMRIFCGGVGPDHPDLTGASRAMTESEWALCVQNGVTEVSEALIGYDGLTIANSRSGPDVALTEAQIFQALAAEIEVDGEIVANPYTNWNQIDASLPDAEIVVLGPPPTSGTRDAFVELVMHDGCNEFETIKALEDSNEDRWEEVCSRMRQDGPFIEAGENDNLIVQRLQQDANAFGIFGYSFLYENQDTLKPVSINGVDPSIETIADSTYPVARPLFFYVKNAHRNVIPGLEDFVAAYMSDDALASDGYLAERGLVSLPDAERARLQEDVLEGKTFTRYGS